MAPVAKSPLPLKELARRFELLSERLLPAAAGLPSASDAGVASYLVRLAQEPHFAKVEADLTQALNLADSLAEELFGVDLVATDCDQRDAVLKRFQSLRLPATHRCFQLLLQLAINGYLCDPVHGGNRGGVAWRALGLWIDRNPGVTSENRQGQDA